MTYLICFSSQRDWKVLHAEYHGKGDRSVEETAGLVGFKLPHEYEDLKEGFKLAHDPK